MTKAQPGSAPQSSWGCITAEDTSKVPVARGMTISYPDSPPPSLCLSVCLFLPLSLLPDTPAFVPFLLLPGPGPPHPQPHTLFSAGRLCLPCFAWLYLLQVTGSFVTLSGKPALISLQIINSCPSGSHFLVYLCFVVIWTVTDLAGLWLLDPSLFFFFQDRGRMCFCSPFYLWCQYLARDEYLVNISCPRAWARSGPQGNVACGALFAHLSYVGWEDLSGFKFPCCFHFLPK